MIVFLKLDFYENEIKIKNKIIIIKVGWFVF